MPPQSDTLRAAPLACAVPALAALFVGACGPAQRSTHTCLSIRPGHADSELVNAAHAAEHDAIGRLLGRFTRGDVAVYTGCVAARENLHVIGRADTHLEGAVLAGVSSEGWGPTLWVVDDNDHVIELFASSSEPGALAATGILSVGTGAGEAGRCRSCVVSLAPPSARITLQHAVFQGSYGEGQTRTIELDLALERVAPEAVTLAQVRRLLSLWAPGEAAALTRALVEEGESVTRGVRGVAMLPLREDATLQTPERPECRRLAEYTARWRISVAHPGDARVEDVCITRVFRRCCAPSQGAAPCSGPPPINCIERDEGHAAR